MCRLQVFQFGFLQTYVVAQIKNNVYFLAEKSLENLTYQHCCQILHQENSSKHGFMRPFMKTFPRSTFSKGRIPKISWVYVCCRLKIW